MIFGSFLTDKIYDTDLFVNIEPTLHPRDDSHLVMMDNPFNVLLDSQWTSTACGHRVVSCLVWSLPTVHTSAL